MSALSIITALVQVTTSAPAPPKPWQLSMQQDGCTVQRQVAATDPFTVALQEKVQNTRTTLLILGPKKTLPNGIGDTAIKFDDENPTEIHYGTFETNEPGTRLLKLFFDDADMARLSAARVVSIGKEGAKFSVNGAGDAVDMLRKCMARRLVALGLNPDLYFQRQTAMVTGNFAALLGADAYPKEAVATGVSGAVLVLLKTAEDGSVAECRVLESENALLDAGTCRAARRGRLKPPLDAEGRPIASYTITLIRWTR